MLFRFQTRKKKRLKKIIEMTFRYASEMEVEIRWNLAFNLFAN